MYTKIKDMAEAAIALQNKIVMEQTLRDISAMCDEAVVIAPKLILAAIAKSISVPAKPTKVASKPATKPAAKKPAKRGSK